MTLKNTPEVSVCVCTFKRPLLLLQLLKSLAAQSFSTTRFEVIVVDNDQAASARPVIMQAAVNYPELVVHYELEPEQGISFARNRTVTLAQGTLLAFIDDDEWAAPHWLSDLVGRLKSRKVDAVLGPVIPHFPSGTRSWVIKCRFFERPRFETGTVIGSRYCRTGNALIKAARLKARWPAAFDNRFALTGGEDYDFFKWLERQGGQFVWCDTALVYETVTLPRQRLDYIFERCLRTSIRYWRDEYSHRSPWWIFQKAVEGIIGGTGYVVLATLLFPFSLGKAVQIGCKGVKGLGRAVALTDLELTGYREGQ